MATWRPSSTSTATPRGSCTPTATLQPLATTRENWWVWQRQASCLPLALSHVSVICMWANNALLYNQTGYNWFCLRPLTGQFKCTQKGNVLPSKINCQKLYRSLDVIFHFTHSTTWLGRPSLAWLACTEPPSDTAASWPPYVSDGPLTFTKSLKIHERHLTS